MKIVYNVHAQRAKNGSKLVSEEEEEGGVEEKAKKLCIITNAQKEAQTGQYL